MSKLILPRFGGKQPIIKFEVPPEFGAIAERGENELLWKITKPAASYVWEPWSSDPQGAQPFCRVTNTSGKYSVNWKFKSQTNNNASYDSNLEDILITRFIARQNGSKVDGFVKFGHSWALGNEQMIYLKTGTYTIAAVHPYYDKNWWVSSYGSQLDISQTPNATDLDSDCAYIDLTGCPGMTSENWGNWTSNVGHIGMHDIPNPYFPRPYWNVNTPTTESTVVYTVTVTDANYGTTNSADFTLRVKYFP